MFASMHNQLPSFEMAFLTVRCWYQDRLYSEEYILRFGSSRCEKGSGNRDSSD